MLKYILSGLTIAAVFGMAVLTWPQDTEAFAFASADGRALHIYACAARDDAGHATRNAAAAHRFLEAQLAITADPQVADLVADLDHAALAIGPGGQQIRRDIAHNLLSTFGCRMLKAQPNPA